MKANNFIATMAVVLFWANASYAQNIEVGIQEEIVQEQAPTKRKTLPAPTAAPGGVVIMNNQNQNAEQSSAQASKMNNQPVTVVEANPIAVSRADAIRKARQNTELQTEQMIVERLEVSRMEDEKIRSERIANSGAFAAASASATAVGAGGAAAASATAVAVNSAPVGVEVLEVVEVKKDKPKKPTSVFALGADAGLISYSVNNIQSNQAFGLTLGSESTDGLIMEAQFMYSNHYVAQYWPLYRDLDQYNISGALKYSFLRDSRIRPFAGGLATFGWRRYYNRIVGTTYQPNGPMMPNDKEMTTYSFDLGVTAGLDFMVSETFSVGADFRYSMNVYNRINNNTFNSGYMYGGTPLEELSYYTMMLTAKVRF